MELASFSIPTFRKTYVQKRLEKLAKKAAKYGNPDITIEFGETRLVTVNTEYGDREYEFIDVIVSGSAPRINGWQLQARIELLGDENLVHNVPGSETKLSDHFRNHKGTCDHCKTNRRRNDVYVLTNSSEQIAVGRSCLRDFLGIDDPKAIVERAQFFEELHDLSEEDMVSGFTKHGYFDLETVLLLAAAYIRKKGYVSKAKQQETGYETTGEAVLFNIKGLNGYDIETTSADKEWASKTIQFFRVDKHFGNDYMDNIRVLMKQDLVKIDHIPLIASSVITAQRALAPKTEVAESNFVGKEKDRIRNLDLMIEKVIYLGQRIDATVKQHKLYNGVKQTVLTRAKQLEDAN
jgi:ribosomal protein L36